jgi:hypothetical protein
MIEVPGIIQDEHRVEKYLWITQRLEGNRVGQTTRICAFSVSPYPSFSLEVKGKRFLIHDQAEKLSEISQPQAIPQPLKGRADGMLGRARTSLGTESEKLPFCTFRQCGVSQAERFPGELKCCFFQLFTIKMLTLLLIPVALGCTPIPANSVCAPWTGYVDLQKLARLYQTETLSIIQWQKRIEEKSKGSPLTPELHKWPQCTDYQGEPIQYYHSFSCMNDIFVISKHCNQAKARPLCPNTCAKLGQAINVFIRDACPLTQNLRVQNRRDQLKQLGQICENIPNLLDHFEGECIEAVDRDRTSCGFGGNLKTAQQYCKDRIRTYNDCCSRIAEQENDPNFQGEERFDVEKQFSDPEDVTDGNSTDDVRFEAFAALVSPKAKPSRSLTQPPNAIMITMTAVTVVAICVCVILGAGICISCAVRTRRRQRAARKVSQRLQIPRRYDSIKSELPSTQTKYIVKYAYVPNLPDEMELKVGDIIQFYQVSDDRWGDAYNLTSFEEGKACTLYMTALNE